MAASQNQTAVPRPLKPFPFTEAQIRERAYALWQAHPEGSAESHWEAAIEALQRERSLGWKLRNALLRTRWWLPGEKGLRALFGNVYQVVRVAFTAKTPGEALDVVKVIISAFALIISALGLLATVTAGIGLYLNYQQGQEKLVTDRFAKAVEQLGSPNIDVRIGGIYSLERIAKDSPKDHWTIMEVLTAFVRNKAPLPKDWTKDSKQELPTVTTDVQSALTVIGRRNVANDPSKEVKFKSESVYIGKLGTNLSHTNLNGADLFGADLSDANLNGTDLEGANLNGADLSGGNLFGADLRRAALSTTNLFLTNLSRASLERTNLRGADLTKTMGLTPTQIKQADNWQHAHYNPAFRKALGLPPEKP